MVASWVHVTILLFATVGELHGRMANLTIAIVVNKAFLVIALIIRYDVDLGEVLVLGLLALWIHNYTLLVRWNRWITEVTLDAVWVFLQLNLLLVVQISDDARVELVRILVLKGRCMDFLMVII